MSSIDVFEELKKRFNNGMGDVDGRYRGCKADLARLSDFAMGFTPAPIPVYQETIHEFMAEKSLRPPSFSETVKFILDQGDGPELMFGKGEFGPTVLFFHEFLSANAARSFSSGGSIPAPHYEYAYITSLGRSHYMDRPRTIISMFGTTPGPGIYPISESKPYWLAGIRIAGEQ